MKKGLKVACLTGVAFSVVGATGAMMMPTEAATGSTSISATVSGTITCSGGSAALGTITPGQAATKTATLSVTTNGASGFTVTTGTLGNLASYSNNIAYNASAAAGTQGWKAVVKTNTSEWKTSASAALTNNTLASGAIWTHGSYSASAVTESVDVTVGTTSTTPSGAYTGSISWTCAVK